jgi:membrane protease YdiL (CAAX protease family)
MTLYTLLVISGLMYFLPAVVACLRHHKSAPGIFVLNLLTGWTLLGWIVSFVWACIGEELESKHLPINQDLV